MSLQLDARQRAMLAEMKVPFWWPQADSASGTTLSAADVVSTVPAPGLPAVAARAPAPAVAAATIAGGHAPAAAPAPDTARDIDRMDWRQLRDTVMACTACGLCEGRKVPVFAIDPLPRQADWLIVGEPPDEHEERAGTPFVGDAGQLLDNMLRAVQSMRGGQGRAGARVTSVVKCRPGVVRNPNVDELAQCAAYLRREIALTQPRVILAMARFAAVSLLAAEHPDVLKTPFGQVRGKLYRSYGLPVVVTYHPAKLLRAPLEKAAAWADLCLARAQVLSSPATPSPASPT